MCIDCKMTMKRIVLIWMVLDLLVYVPVVHAKPALSNLYGTTSRADRVVDAMTLPQCREIVSGISGIDREEGRLTVHQDAENAIISWDTFDIGSAAETVFDQKGKTDWAVLNRIYDANPSLILGKLNADGRIFLINQNGMVFGPDASVNVHSLTATSLNVDNDAFMEGSWKKDSIELGLGSAGNAYQADNYQSLYYGSGRDQWNELKAEIRNEGYIQADVGGEIFLVGPRVSNAGAMDAPSGQVGLIAAAKASLDHDEKAYRESIIIRNIAGTSESGSASLDGQPFPGEAVNEVSGRITTDLGFAGMYGRVVNQQGFIRTVTAIQSSGKIDLRATDRIITGPESHTEAAISDDPEKQNESAITEPSRIALSSALAPVSIDPKTGLVIYGYKTPESISISGDIVGPSANVDISAVSEIEIKSGATIDVSGIWALREAFDNQLEVSLNSVELADFFNVREGDMFGETVFVNALKGCDVGHIDGYLSSRKLNSRQRFTKGGTVQISAEKGRFSMEEGALIDFSGGGFFYSAGQVKSSKVAFGSTVYDISDIPDYVVSNGDRLTLLSEDDAARLNLSMIDNMEAYTEGHDAGGLSIVAGIISLNGSIDGSATRGIYQTLATDPTVEIGDFYYRIARGLAVPLPGTLKLGIDNKSGVDSVGFALQDVVIYGTDDSFDFLDEGQETSLIAAESLNDAGVGKIVIHANNQIVLSENASLILPASHGNGLFEAIARNVEIYGSIQAAGGTVRLGGVTIQESGYGRILDSEGILVASGSSIDVSGEEKNITPANFENMTMSPDYLEGGQVILKGSRSIAGIRVEPGSLIDVSGGFESDWLKGSLVGGDAGGASAESVRVELNGEIDGHSLVGYRGGSLNLWADAIIFMQDPATDNGDGGLTITPEWIKQSGMSDISLKSRNDMVLENVGLIEPSREKYIVLQDEKRLYRTSQEKQVVEISDDDHLTSSSISLAVGTGIDGLFDNDARIYLDESSMIEVSPQGTILLNGPEIEIEGTLRARSGKIEIEAFIGDIILAETALVDATGYTRVEPVLANNRWVDRYTPIDGGAISLIADAPGSAIMFLNEFDDSKSPLLTVAGAPAVKNTYFTRDGKIIVETAGQAGAISMKADRFDTENLKKVFLDGHAGATGYGGGGLTIFQTYDQTDPLTAYEQSKTIDPYNLRWDTMGYLTLSDEQLRSFSESGFDAITLRSLMGIAFTGSGSGELPDEDIRFDRMITLDAPLIMGPSRNQERLISLKAPYVVLENGYEKYFERSTGEIVQQIHQPQTYRKDGTDLLLLEEALGDASNSLTITSTWMDISGEISLAGFGQLDFLVQKDIRLSDQPSYLDRESKEAVTFLQFWNGGLTALADLNLTADRIYPQTDVDFTIASGFNDPQQGWIGGNVWIYGTGKDADLSTVFSAGGNLNIISHGIYVNGNLAAPMGQIQLTAFDRAESGGGISSIEDGWIILGENGYIGASGDADVVYGVYDQDSNWHLPNKTDASPNNDLTLVSKAPDISISLNASTIRTMPGSMIDVSGGGSVYAYIFAPSISGSADPLKNTGRYVVLPGNAIEIPGQAVYLEGAEGLTAGVYSLLPETYAFLPGAVILEDLGEADPSNPILKSNQGDTVIEGYKTFSGTEIRTSPDHLYAIRAANEVLEEGQFYGNVIDAGNGGSLTVAGDKTAIEGLLKGEGIAGYLGGSANLSASSIFVGNFDPIGAFDLILRTDSLSGSGFERVELGLSEIGNDDLIEGFVEDFLLLNASAENQNGALSVPSNKIVIGENTSLQSNSLGLYAETVEIESGASVITEELIIQTPDSGKLKVSESAVIQSKRTGLFVGHLEFDGILTSDEVLTLGSHNPISFMSEDAGSLPSSDGFDQVMVGANIWNGFGGAQYVSVISPSGINTFGAVNAAAESLLELKTPQLAAYGGGLPGESDARTVWHAADMVIHGISGTAKTIIGDTVDLMLAAERTLTFPRSDMRFVVSEKVLLQCGGDMIFGTGSLDTGDKNIDLTSARLTSTFYIDDQGTYETEDDVYRPANFSINAGQGTVIVASSGRTAEGAQQIPGSVFEITADTIKIEEDALLDFFSGRIALNATGNNVNSGIFLSGKVSAQGGILFYDTIDLVQAYEAGQVELYSIGKLVVDENAAIDVSFGIDRESSSLPDMAKIDEWLAGGLMDAGSISIFAPDAGSDDGFLVLDGEISGSSTHGSGGSFILDSENFDLDAVSEKLGDFTKSLSFRARQGNVMVHSPVRAEQIKIVADSGAISVDSVLDASGTADTRRIELYAAGDISLTGNALLDVHGTESGMDGGEIFVDSTGQWIRMATDARINAAGGSDAEGGIIHFRASRNAGNNEVQMTLKGTVSGAKTIWAEAVRYYTGKTLISGNVTGVVKDDATGLYTVNGDGTAGGTSLLLLKTIAQDNLNFMTHASAIEARFTLDGLISESGAEALLVPGVEVQSSQDLTLDLIGDWDLNASVSITGSADAVPVWRYGMDRDIPGVLTLRAAGHLKIEDSIVDSPQMTMIDGIGNSNHLLIFEPQTGDSWNITLTAGADLAGCSLSPDPMAVADIAYVHRFDDGALNLAKGDLCLNKDGVMVYSESGSLRFAAAQNLAITKKGGETPFLIDEYGSAVDHVLFNLGTFDGRIRGVVGNDLQLANGIDVKAGGIQTATGDIYLDVAGDILLGYGDAIRTTGKPPAISKEDIEAAMAAFDNLFFEYLWTGEFNQWSSLGFGNDYSTWKDYIGTTSDFNFDYILDFANTSWWDFQNGGDIAISAGRDITAFASIEDQEWISLYVPMPELQLFYLDFDPDTPANPLFSGPAYSNSIIGILTMGGGNMEVSSGGDMKKLQVGAFGEGNMKISTGGDFDGRLLAAKGEATVSVMGNYGVHEITYSHNQDDQAIELLDSRLSMTVQGDARIGAILNPMSGIKDLAELAYVGYTEDTAASVTSVYRDVILVGHSDFHNNLTADEMVHTLLPPTLTLRAGGDILFPLTESSARLTLAPSDNGSLTLVAGNDISGDLGNERSAMIIMSDMAPEMIYAHYPRPAGYDRRLKKNNPSSTLLNPDFHGFTDLYMDVFSTMWNSHDADKEKFVDIFESINSRGALHGDDEQASLIRAGNDIRSLQLISAEAAMISAGRDMTDIFYLGQNTDEEDLTSIEAGRNIRLSLSKSIREYPEGEAKEQMIDKRTGLQVAGPGWFTVRAGHSIDLGNTGGIRTRGSEFNAKLASTGASLIVAAGYSCDIFGDSGILDADPYRVVEFFAELQTAGAEYSSLKRGFRIDENGLKASIDIEWVRSMGAEYADLVEFYDNYADVEDAVRDDLAGLRVDQARSELISPYLQAINWSEDSIEGSAISELSSAITRKDDLRAGSVGMIKSQISTDKGGDIYLVSADQLNVGLSAFQSTGADSGINAKLEGGVHLFTVKDININESRVVTWYGGDIMMWSDRGNINAGKGSKTTKSFSEKSSVYNGDRQQYYVINSPPVEGSGIQILTHDPDGIAGPLAKADPGVGYLFAPDGEIDAGEAGIKGLGNLILEARRLVNVQNIETAGISVGVSAETENTGVVATMTGVGSLIEAGSLSDDSTLMASAREKLEDSADRLSEALTPKWLSVEVIGFEEKEEEEKE